MSEDQMHAVTIMNALPDISGEDSERLQGFVKATSREVKAVGGASAGTTLEMIGYIRELEHELRSRASVAAVAGDALPSLADAIRIVENCEYENVAVDVILQRLKALMPAAVASSPSPASPQQSPTREAIEEIAALCEHESYCASNERYPSPKCDGGLNGKITAIITKHFAATEGELRKLRQAIGWICDAADAAYIEDPNNERNHEIFNIAAKAAGIKRRLPDEHGRFDESSIG